MGRGRLPHGRSGAQARGPTIASRRTSATQSTASGARRKHLLYSAAGLGLVALVAYWNSFSAGLVLDNKFIIENNARIHSWNPDTLTFIFTHNYWWPEQASDLYRPLTTATYWANYTLLGGGTNVTGYHVLNFLLHWANALLVFLIAERFTTRRDVAFVAAAFFAVHPAGTEAVTNIVGRADLLATLAVLGGGWLIMHGRFVLAGTVAFAGVFFKESAVNIGVFVVLYDWIVRWPGVVGAALKERIAAHLRVPGVVSAYACLVPAAVAILVTRYVVTSRIVLHGQAFVANPIAGADPFTGFMTACKVFARYVVLTLFPLKLSSDYSYDQIPLFGMGSAWENAQSWIGLALLIVIVVAGVRLRRTKPALAWGFLWFVGALLATSNLFFPIGTIMGDRLIYMSLAGASVVIATALMSVGERFTASRASPRAVFVLPAIVIALFAARSIRRNVDWQSDLSLWESAVLQSPESYNTHKGYAGALLAADQSEPNVDVAIAHVERALAILEKRPLPERDRDALTLIDLGVYYRLKAQRRMAAGDSAAAGEFLSRSVTAISRARDIDQWVNRATREARLRRGESPDSITDVGNYTIYFELGNTHLVMRDWAAARADARDLRRLMPYARDGYVIDGVAQFYERHPDSAAVFIAAGLLLDGRGTNAWENLAACFRALNLPPPIIEQSGSFRFDPGSQLTAQLLSRAAPMLVRGFEAAKLHDEAFRWRDRLIREFGLPPDVFR